MDASYPYPVFFECPSLDAERRRRIENYFQIYRKSAGGDCGSVTRINDEVYSVAFRERDAQQRVLQRSKHVLEFAGGPLVLTVRDSPGPASQSVSTGLDLTSPQQRQQSDLTSNLLTSGEEYELQFDTYLLHYLKECPKAGKELEKELGSVACSAQLHPEEGKVLVRSLTQPAAVDAVRNWKAEVDKIFDGYVCHYEVDPRKVKALLQSRSSRQTTHDMKVYSEAGVAVVVGERSQVEATLRDLEMSHVERALRLSETQTSIFRLGEAKLRLLWEDIERSLPQDYPGVKVTQGGEGQLVLEGSVEEIVKAGDWISDKENLVFERTVSDKSPHFFAFLMKAYGGPGLLGDLLGVGDKVEVELRDTGLRFFTLSADKLGDTEKKLQEAFKEVKIDVPNCSAVPSDLREKLKAKTNYMNQRQYRAQVVFGSDSTVCLLGHTEEVEELSEAVTQFILDQSSVQSTVHLPFPELAQELPELLQLHGFDYSGVTFHPSTSSAGPIVVLEGPSSKVTEVRNRLGPLLDSLVQDRVTIDSLGAVRNFQIPSGNEDEKSLSEVNTVVASYSLGDGLQVEVCLGDITKQHADALVNAANEDLDHCGGVAAALSKAGGPEVQSESNTVVKCNGKIATGDVVVTTGGNLNCKKLLHAVGPVGGKAGGKERALLEKVVSAALNLSEIMKFQSIAIPCISSGNFGVPVTVCSEAIVTAVKEFGSRGGRSLGRVILIDNREEVVRAMREACDRILQGISTGNSAPSDLGFPMGAAAPDTARGATAGAPGGGVCVEIIQGTIETQQVDALVSPMVGHDPLSTRVGNTLFKIVGPQLTACFRKEAREETLPGDLVLVEGFSGLPANAVLFLNLAPWDNDQDGTALQVLRSGINEILTSCESRGFGSVALPVLGAGIVLRFPDSVVARVLLEEVHAFEKNRASRTPFLVRIVIHPNEREVTEEFQSVQKDFQLKEFTDNVLQKDQVSTTKRIILLGKTGAGKSNLANTIFGEKLFTTNHSPNSGTRKCQSETKSVNGRSITLIDTPGFFDTDGSEEEMKPEILRCITECAPGPHAFLIVLKVEKFTAQEQAVVTKICQCFSEEALKHAVIVFTHGDQLPKGMKIEEFVSQNKNLSDLVKKCGGRCHVIDNKYWKNKVQNNYRSNQLQVEELLNTVDKMVMENNGGYYINAMIQAVEKEIQKEEEHIKQSSGNMPLEVIRKQAKATVSDRYLIQLAGTATGALLGAFFGVAAMVGLVITAFKNSAGLIKVVRSFPAAAAGGFSENFSHTERCQPCTECTGLFRMKAPCTDSNDATCVCNYGYFLNTLSEKCEPCTKCPEGHGMLFSCESDHDTVCEECNGDTYSDQESSREPCIPCTTCDEGEMLKPCTSLTDTVCLVSPTPGYFTPPYDDFLQDITPPEGSAGITTTTTTTTNGDFQQILYQGLHDKLIPIYCSILAAVVVGLVAFIIFKRWNSCKQNKQGANNCTANQNQTPSPEGEKLPSDSGISVDSQSLQEQQAQTQAQTVVTMDEEPCLLLPLHTREKVEELLFRGSEGDDCNHMDDSDWCNLAGLLGYEEERISTFRQEEHPVRALLSDWASKDCASIDTLCTALRKINRNDIAQSLVLSPSAAKPTATSVV